MIEQITMNVKEQLMHSMEHLSIMSDTIINKETRTQAKEAYLALGIPTTKHEEWKFTNVNPFLKEAMAIDNFTKIDFLDSLSINDILSKHLEEIKAQMKGESKGAYRLVLMNGNIVNDLSYLPDTKTCKIDYISALSTEEKEGLQIGTIAPVADHHFTALNTALIQDGLFIQVPQDTVIDKPIHIIHILDNKQPTFYNTRAFVHVAKSAKVEIVETYLSTQTEQNKVFINAVYEFQLENQAICDHYDIQKTNSSFHQIKRTEVSQALHSNYSNYNFNLPGGALFRNNLSIHINAKDTECHLYGLYLINDTQLVDNHTEVHHKYPNGESNQLYKGILLEASKAVFNGKIFVYEDAQKTNAFQKSANLLLSDTATINTKPQLEIFADDVKCSHGTTIGQMDEQALFYLKSRGLSPESAKKMMVNAFAFDVAEKVKNQALRQYIEEQIVLAIN